MSGQKLVIFGDVRFPVPAHVQTIADAKAVAQTMVPGLSDAEGHEDSDGNFVFAKKAGTKGC